eukprot:5775276-Alexandrium_andersonii.AAC.1
MAVVVLVARVVPCLVLVLRAVRVATVMIGVLFPMISAGKQGQWHAALAHCPRQARTCLLYTSPSPRD